MILILHLEKSKIISRIYKMAGRPTSPASKSLGARMKQILKQLGISQEQAALRLGLSAQAVLNNYINGRSEIPINVINRFCAEFHVPVATLFDNDDITITADDDLVMDIMLIVDEFLSKNHVTLSPDQRKKLIRGFLAKNCHDAERINDTLSALLAVNGDMFIKGK